MGLIIGLHFQFLLKKKKKKVGVCKELCNASTAGNPFLEQNY